VVEDSVNWLRNNDVKPRTSTSYGSDEPRTPMPKGHIDSRKEEGH
jgi:hypothetical protein